MSRGISDFPKIDLDTIVPNGYDRETEKPNYKHSIENMKFVQKPLLKAYEVSLTNELPPELNARVNGLVKEFIDFVDELESDYKGFSITDFTQKKSNLLNRINSWTTDFLSISSSNNRIAVCNMALAFKKDEQLQEEVDLKK